MGFLQLNRIETGAYHRQVQTALATVRSGPLIPAQPLVSPNNPEALQYKTGSWFLLGTLRLQPQVTVRGAGSYSKRGLLNQGGSVRLGGPVPSRLVCHVGGQTVAPGPL